MTDAKGVRIGFLYDTRRRLIGTYLDANKDEIANASEAAVRYVYDSEGYLQKIETDGTDYTFGYDHHGNVLTVKAGNYTLATNTYGPFDGALQTSTTGNGLKTTYEYDRLGRLAGVKENGAQLYSLTYNGDGQAARLVDNASGETTEYEYDARRPPHSGKPHVLLVRRFPPLRRKPLRCLRQSSKHHLSAAESNAEIHACVSE